MKQDFEYTTARGHRTTVTLYGADLPPDAPCVVYLHGFKGFKDWGWVPYIAECLDEFGIRLLAPNFSHNGIGAVPDQFTELDKFRDNTFSLEVEEAVEEVEEAGRGDGAGLAAHHTKTDERGTPGNKRASKHSCSIPKAADRA